MSGLPNIREIWVACAARRFSATLIFVLSFLFVAAQHSAALTVNVRAQGRISKSAEREVTSLVESQIAELSEYYDFRYDKQVTVFIAGTEQGFAEEVGPGVPYWAAAIARRRYAALSPRAGIDSQRFESTLKHELSHVVLGEKFARRPGALPRWLNEGLSMSVSGEWDMNEGWITSKSELYSALKNGKLMDFEDISDGFPAATWEARLAYAQSFHFTDYLLRRFGHKRMNDLLDRLARGEEFHSAFKAATGKRFSRAHEYWKARLEGVGGVGLLLLSLYHVDTLIWGGMALLVLLAFFRFLWRRRRDEREEEDLDEGDDLWDQWDDDTMGRRPWRPPDSRH